MYQWLVDVEEGIYGNPSAGSFIVNQHASACLDEL